MSKRPNDLAAWFQNRSTKLTRAQEHRDKRAPYAKVREQDKRSISDSITAMEDASLNFLNQQGATATGLRAPEPAPPIDGFNCSVCYTSYRTLDDAQRCHDENVDRPICFICKQRFLTDGEARSCYEACSQEIQEDRNACDPPSAPEMESEHYADEEDLLLTPDDCAIIHRALMYSAKRVKWSEQQYARVIEIAEEIE